jgi:predicted alpha/beta-fold hydrolase
MDTPDGDFVDLDWVNAADVRAPLIVVLHGLEGSSRSHYVQGLCREAAAAGFRAVVMHFRSCGGELNRVARLYHSGDTSDLDLLLRILLEREPAARLALVGVSLGGNVLLKWLGEQGDAAPDAVLAAVAISTPFDLGECARVLDVGLRRHLYTASFLRTMRPKILLKRHLYDGRLDLDAVRRARTFAQYDRCVTAPLFGFADERDYWTRSSSTPYLAKIRRPTLLINAVNDPFVPPTALPRAEIEGSPWVEAAFVPEGGHAGFLEGPWGRRSWAERRAIAFLQQHVAGPS